MQMERIFCDFEFNGHGGELISMGLAGPRHCDWLYVVNPKFAYSSHPPELDPWVAENVIPFLNHAPVEPKVAHLDLWGLLVSDFLYKGRGDAIVQIFADWPSDIADLCNLMMTGPGTAVAMPHQTNFTVLRHLEVYPTSLKFAVRHNALWDALALKRWVEEQGK